MNKFVDSKDICFYKNTIYFLFETNGKFEWFQYNETLGHGRFVLTKKTIDYWISDLTLLMVK